MAFILTKMSVPGWEKEFNTEEETRDELFRYICNECRKDDEINSTSDIGLMLGTACGCEFWYEGVR
jgi:hypothetical protein